MAPVEKYLATSGAYYKINLAGMYPIYNSEIPIYNQLGPEEFWKHPGFNPYKVGRNPIVK